MAMPTDTLVLNSDCQHDESNIDVGVSSHCRSYEKNSGDDARWLQKLTTDDCDCLTSSDFPKDTVIDDVKKQGDETASQNGCIPSDNESSDMQTSGEKIKLLTDNNVNRVLSCMRDLQCPFCQNCSISKLPSDLKCSEEELHIWYCDECQSCFGVHDYMDKDDFQGFLERVKMTIESTPMCPCGNNDINKLVLTGFDSYLGRPTIECQCCRASALNKLTEEYNDGGGDDCTDSGRVIGTKNDQNDAIESNSNDLVRESFVGDSCPSNDNINFFSKRRHDYEALLMSVRGLQCDQDRKVLERSSSDSDLTRVDTEPNNDPTYPHCPDERLFSVDDNYDRLKSAISSRCKSSSDISGNDCASDCERSSEKPVSFKQVAEWEKSSPDRRKVTNIHEVMAGDHVAWDRFLGYSHHAIVVATPSNSTMLTVVHYTRNTKIKSRYLCAVQEDEVKVNPAKDHFYVYDYANSCHPPSVVVERARSRVGEHSYNVVFRNCEHLANWCKRGVEKSNQVIEFWRRIYKTIASMLSKGAQEGAITEILKLFDDSLLSKVLGIGKPDGLDRVLDLFGFGGLSKGVAEGFMSFNVLLNLFLEVGFFSYEANMEHKKYMVKDITLGDFHKHTFQRGCESVGGLIGALGVGVLGQMALPVPRLGSIIGNSLGTLLCRCIGSIVGKKLSSKLFDQCDSAIDCMKDSLLNRPCLFCHSSNTSKIIRYDQGTDDDDLHIRHCKECQSCFVVDDSMDDDDLRRLLGKGEVTIKSMTECQCGNDDILKFVVTGFDSSSRRPTIECQRCGTPALGIINVDFKDDDNDYGVDDEIDGVDANDASHDQVDYSDTRSMQISIPDYQFVEHGTERFVVFHIWLAGRHICSRRYSEFLKLHSSLRQEFSDFRFPKFPRRRLFWTSEKQLDARRRGLEAYLERVLMDGAVAACCSMQEFLSDGTNDTNANGDQKVLE